MSDLPDCAPLYVTNTQRRHAALALAEHFAADRDQLVQHLLMLGLAEHAGDIVRAVPDPIGENWFAPVSKPYS